MSFYHPNRFKLTYDMLELHERSTWIKFAEIPEAYLCVLEMLNSHQGK